MDADNGATKQVPADQFVDLAGCVGVGAFADVDGKGLTGPGGVVELPFPVGLETDRVEAVAILEDSNGRRAGGGEF
jgi:peptidoglycan hydrolase-like protein with peptidoglycan-binding domain